MIPTINAQKKLMVLWSIGGLIVFLFLILRSIGDMYGQKVEDAWSWFLPTVVPTLSLMITVAVVNFSQSSDAKKQSDKFLFQLALGLSLIYLLLVMVTILNPFGYDSPIEFMKKSNLWLGPLQGLVTAALGAFFVKSK